MDLNLYKDCQLFTKGCLEVRKTESKMYETSANKNLKQGSIVGAAEEVPNKKDVEKKAFIECISYMWAYIQDEFKVLVWQPVEFHPETQAYFCSCLEWL